MNELETIEIIKELEFNFNEFKPILKVKVKILKHDENSYSVRLSHHCKRIGDSEYYTPGWGAISIEHAEQKLQSYFNDFTENYILNPNY